MTPCSELCISQAGAHEYPHFDTTSNDNVRRVIIEKTVVEEVSCKLLDLLVREEEEIVQPQENCNVGMGNSLHLL